MLSIPGFASRLDRHTSRKRGIHTAACRLYRCRSTILGHPLSRATPLGGNVIPLTWSLHRHAAVIRLRGLTFADDNGLLLGSANSTSKKKVTPMGNAYEIYALRYATMSPRTPHLNFLIPDPHETTAQDLDYFVWLIRGGGRDILVDTGFNAEEAKARSRKLTLNPVDALANFGVAADTIRDVIVTHLHYDHAGNLDRFPNARFHLQDREMSYATGRCMCNGMLRHPFSVEHVTTMVRHVYGERVTFHSGDGEIAPGVTVHRVGGHSDGLQVVRVETARGPVVLASDAAHYYANLQKRSPFPIVYNVGDMAQGWEIVERLAGHPDRFIPGHDPIVSEIYPRASEKVDAFALHLAPSRSFVK
jgi:glyoxylase-like metal-dependent hydrolase (beta-lactamase superfamily II)